MQVKQHWLGSWSFHDKKVASQIFEQLHTTDIIKMYERELWHCESFCSDWLEFLGLSYGREDLIWTNVPEQIGNFELYDRYATALCENGLLKIIYYNY